MKYFHTFSSLKCLGQRLDGVNESVKLCHINPCIMGPSAECPQQAWETQSHTHDRTSCRGDRSLRVLRCPRRRGRFRPRMASDSLSLSRSVQWTTEVAVLSLSLSLPLPQKQQAPNQKLQPSRRCEQEVMRNDTSPLTWLRAQLRARSPESKLAFARFNPLPL